MANNTQSTNNAKANNWLISEWSKTKKGDGIIFSIYRRTADNSGRKWEYGKVYVPLRHAQDWDEDKAAALIRDSRTTKGAQEAIICIPVEHVYTPPKAESKSQSFDDDGDIPF